MSLKAMVTPSAEAPQSLRGLRDTRLDLDRCTDGVRYRHDLADLVDTALADLFEQATDRSGIDPSAAGVALAAVGSHGRRDAGPTSDLDLMLIHDGRSQRAQQINDLATALWYPIWDAGLDLDHSVRSLTECRSVASADLPAAVGLLDVRVVAGDAEVVDRARAAVLRDWRIAARRRFHELITSIRDRAERAGELSQLSEPDLKECRGGLRDAVVLRSLTATWLADRPHGAVDHAINLLLDVRDGLALASARPGSRLLRVHQDAVAAGLGLVDADELLTHLAGAARLISFSLDATLRHARQAVDPTPAPAPRWVRGRRRPPLLRQVADGIVIHDGELVLAAGVAAESDHTLPLRAAAAAARTGLPLSQPTLSALAQAPPPAAPWPVTSRHLLLELLRSGPAQLPVWEALDLADLPSRWFVEWAGVRNRGQRSPVHVFTVDRHLVQTVANLGAAPDNLADRDTVLWAGLFHDIGKTRDATDHSVTGARLTAGIVSRLGLDPHQQERVVRLVRHHLLLVETATGADLHDPAEIAEVADRLDHDVDLVMALRHLSQADAEAAGPTVWTPWKARLVDMLTTHVVRHIRSR